MTKLSYGLVKNFGLILEWPKPTVNNNVVSRGTVAVTHWTRSAIINSCCIFIALNVCKQNRYR